MKNVFAILFVTLLASCSATQTEEAQVEADSTAVEVVELPVEVVVDTTRTDTTVFE